VERASEQGVGWQVGQRRTGGAIVQETRLWVE